MDAAKAKATIVANNEATKVMKNYTYDDFVKIYKDTSRKYNNASIKYYNYK